MKAGEPLLPEYPFAEYKSRQAGRVQATVTLPGGVWQPGPAVMAMLALPFCVWMLNLYNFMDGMDGFAGGMTVFPGGGVDERDYDLFVPSSDGDADIAWTGPDRTWWAGKFGVDAVLAGALVCAAARETFEECGVLFAGPAGDPDGIVSDASAYHDSRVALESRELSFGEFLARENLVFFASLYGMDRPGAVADAALERAGLAARGGDLVSSFSRGMRQRVALERALLHGPRLLLLDEPFTGLDQASTASLVARLRAEQARGVITILATHDLDVVDGVLSDVVFLQGGRRVAGTITGTTLRDRYHAAMQDGPRS